MYLHTCTIFGSQQSYKGSHLVSEFFGQLRKYHIMIWHVHTCKYKINFITVNSLWGCLPLILSDLTCQTKVLFALWQKKRVKVCKNIWKFCCYQFFIFETLFAPETSTSFCVTKNVNKRNYKWSCSQIRWSDEG